MKDIVINAGVVTFESSVCGLVDSEITELEVVDEFCYHLGTNIGTFLINVKQFSVNSIIFETANEAVSYITSL